MSNLNVSVDPPFSDVQPSSWPDELLVTAAVASYWLAPLGQAVSAFDEAIRTEVDRRGLRRQIDPRTVTASENLSQIPARDLQQVA